ncbi:MAG: hypothetical protein K0Q73_809 [Paenibacillus sp.]|nr:hypothetical protein [Paenibacillus sp.]
MAGQLLSARFIFRSSIIMLLLSFMVGCDRNSNVIPATNQFDATSDTKQNDEKKLVREKMQNAGKNYNTLKGTFSYIFDKSSSDFEFQIRQGNKAASFLRQHRLQSNNSDYTIFDGTYLLSTWDSFRDPSVRYPMHSWEQDELKHNSAVPFNIGGIPHPHELSNSVLSSTDLWMIEKEETFLGRSAYVILAGSDPKASPPSKQTRIWVDKQTGVLLKKDHLYEGNKTNTLVEMTQFEVDVPLDNHSLTIPSDFIALLHLSPDKEQEEINQVKLALQDFYKRRSKQDFPDPILDYTITQIKRMESASMEVHVEEKLKDGKVRMNVRHFYKKQGEWLDG